MYKCDVCSKQLVNTRSLMLHKRTHDGDDGRRPFACDHCDRVYKYEESMKRHVKITHECEYLRSPWLFKLQPFLLQLNKFSSSAITARFKEYKIRFEDTCIEFTRSRRETSTFLATQRLITKFLEICNEKTLKKEVSFSF